MIEAWLRSAFIMVLSQSLAGEGADVARCPYIKERYRLAGARIRLTERRIERDAEIVTELPPLPPGLVVRDPKDMHVLQTALAGRADYLVTGDGDLRSLDGHTLLGGLRACGT